MDKASISAVLDRIVTLEEVIGTYVAPNYDESAAGKDVEARIAALETKCEDLFARSDSLQDLRNAYEEARRVPGVRDDGEGSGVASMEPAAQEELCRNARTDLESTVALLEQLHTLSQSTLAEDRSTEMLRHVNRVKEASDRQAALEVGASTVRKEVDRLIALFEKTTDVVSGKMVEWDETLARWEEEGTE